VRHDSVALAQHHPLCAPPVVNARPARQKLHTDAASMHAKVVVSPSVTLYCSRRRVRHFLTNKMHCGVVLCSVLHPSDPQSKRIAQLEGTLKHLRGWMQHVQDNMQANGLQKDTVFNARRLFVGGIPAGATEASDTTACNSIAVPVALARCVWAAAVSACICRAAAASARSHSLHATATQSSLLT
jgi:hypothetical protein